MRWVWMLLALAACGGDRRPAGPDDAGAGDALTDGFVRDGDSDGDFPDSAPGDAMLDATTDGALGDGALGDAGFGDGGFGDGGFGDAGIGDAGLGDGGLDGSISDAGDGFDAAGGADCLSGATGTHVVRFRWEGTSSGGRATVRLEENTLPDTSRWSANAYSRSIGYTPVWRDPFLGEGGLELSGTVFIDVELSTAGLGSVSNATLAIYGRSYNTTTSGSFEWMTFSGSGASPHGGVSNSAPYEWYGANATTALPAGDDGTLLRIEAGPPSNALIVNRVEICFTAS